MKRFFFRFFLVCLLTGFISLLEPCNYTPCYKLYVHSELKAEENLPDDVVTLTSHAEYYYSSGEYDKAKACAEKALTDIKRQKHLEKTTKKRGSQLDYAKAHTLYRIVGQVYIEEGKLNDAADMLKLACDEAPYNGDHAARLAQCCEMQGNYDRAVY
ncbi:MAG: tetratricopeptide repeat protein [Candidatus Riflebacteria bacterium]|nr:tetratricopeptide repeat protein [Candidatus Riflebacteria bacterium]